MKTETLLKGMNILAWIIFVCLLIVAGSVVVSYFASIGNPQAAKNLYEGLDLSAYREHSLVHYTFAVAYKVILYLAQAYVAFLMTRLLSGWNISKPFGTDVVKRMQQTGNAILCIWVVTMVHNIHLHLLERYYGLTASYLSGDSILLVGVVYVLVQFFKRGVEIQSENELTV